jgi:N-acetylglucosaminyl-diphospho-decaprenol L-rhamnosyltransferase
MADVSVIIVTYESAHCLSSVLQTIPAATEIIVVANASRDASRDLARAHGCRVVVNASNIGFGPACNIGAKLATRTYLLFLNPDALLAPGALDALLAGAARHPHASGFHARRIVGALRTEAAGDSEVGRLSGACLFVERAIFEKVQGFDENIFLYFEDEDLSLRLRQAHGPTLEIGDAVVQHHQGGGSKLTTLQRFVKYRHYGRSRVYFARKHGIAFDPRREALRQCVKAIGRVFTLRLGEAAQHVGRCVGYLSGPKTSPSVPTPTAVGQPLKRPY